MCRARLRPTGIEGSDYINASFIDVHHKVTFNDMFSIHFT